MQATILIVDDEKHTRDGLRRLFDDDYDTYVAEDIAGAMSVLEREQIDVMITDLRLAGDDGMALIERALKLPHPPICIMMTAYGSVDTAVEAMKRGAYDFVTKPLNLDKVEMLIGRALGSRRLEQENRTLRQQVDERYGLENVIGESAALREVLDVIRQVAPSSANVLIDGESGTGKELAAHAIHNLSRRSKAKFVTVHCAALSPTLLESELFGHERGAFTGAHERRIGRFEQANGGTIFLDEIGEIDGSTQVKLLRVISEERTFERVGGNQPLKADVRLIAATNKDLEKLVSEGKFRDDLFFRLNVVHITMPPLRARKEDIPLLVHGFLRHFCKVNEKPLLDLTAEAMNTLLTYDWPGNVRELRTAIEHGVVMASGPKITLRELPTNVRRAAGATMPAGISPARSFSEKPSPLDLHETERRLIAQALATTSGNITAAAKKLGISRRTLHRKINEMNAGRAAVQPDGEGAATSATGGASDAG
ncbi:MAG: Two-component system response regulator protein [uncultured Chthoniobacterales bacterium]|uniref:Two-component system response regulator protein n=1 Tax=uncultured Chthoniobacterales bacterium TaxID=1836801 RepID=A0A6J4HZP9_9BACT|nr:MAG: Two-component system response regulator protein [uncultured Chthoniobacterales bacterium]